MKKTEMLIALEDYLSVKGVAFEDFYAIRMDDKIRLQGNFNCKIIKSLRDSHLWSFDDCGYAETIIDLPAENQEIIPVIITLT